MKILRFLGVMALCGAAVFYNTAANSGDMQASVAHVIDGDTFVTGSGDHVRLLGINTPETAKEYSVAQPYSEEAFAVLKNMLHGQAVTLKLGAKKKDKYKRLLAQVYLKDGTWVNGNMVKMGAAHVYSFPDTVGGEVQKLLALEAKAREAKRGLWALPRWRVLAADEDFSGDVVGHFYLVEGVVRNVAEVKGRLYLNFGDDWRTDFTAEVAPKYRKKFGSRSDYMGKRVLVRGVMKPVNGMMISMTHAEQIEILD